MSDRSFVNLIVCACLAVFLLAMCVQWDERLDAARAKCGPDQHVVIVRDVWGLAEFLCAPGAPE